MLFKSRVLICLVMFFYGVVLVSADVSFTESEMNTVFGEYNEQVNFTYLDEQEMILTDGKAWQFYVFGGLIGAGLGASYNLWQCFGSSIVEGEFSLKEFVSAGLDGVGTGFVLGAISPIHPNPAIFGCLASRVGFLSGMFRAACRKCHGI